MPAMTCFVCGIKISEKKYFVGQGGNSKMQFGGCHDNMMQNQKSRTIRGTPRAKSFPLVNRANDFTNPFNLTSHITEVMQPVRLSEVNTRKKGSGR